MRIATSYFYQIRNFKKNMIPLSTAIWDPDWFHDFTKDYTHIFYDKRGIANGIRLEAIIEQGKKSNNGTEVCPCENKDYNTCSFLKNYRENLENIDFEEMIKSMQDFADWYAEENDIKEEIILVLIVYETPDNMCSERLPLQEYFTAHGYECKELEYPIQNFKDIKREEFVF